MPKLSLFKPVFMQRTLANRRRRAAVRLQRAYRRRRAGRRGLYRKPRAGGSPIIVPIKCGYSYQLVGGGTSSLALDADVGLQHLPAAWFARYPGIFQHVRINKVRIEVTCPYNIGQHGVGTQSLFNIWSKKAVTTAETPPGDLTEWQNMQNAKRSTFSGRNNSINYYFTPGFEETAQPLNVAATQLKVLYKQWMSMPANAGQCVPHIGMIGHIYRTDGSIIDNTNIFNVNVTLYCQMKGILQL